MISGPAQGLTVAAEPALRLPFPRDPRKESGQPETYSSLPLQALASLWLPLWGSEVGPSGSGGTVGSEAQLLNQQWRKI